MAERLRFDLTSDLGYRYPGAEDAAAMRTLTELCRDRLEDRYEDAGTVRADALARLDQELRIIERLGLPGFFLLHHDMLELAREVALEVRGPGSVRSLLPPGRGRGSSVSSIVCFLTGLSHVDPIANDLLIGRFLNEELTSLPDIDLDFPRDIREKLIPRVHERYGHDRSALVAAFPTYRARGAIRELGKALGLPPGEIERVARGSEGWDAKEVDRDIASAFGLERSGVAKEDGRRGSTGRWAWLARLAAEAHGLPRHLSQHSGGMIVATRPLIDCCPIVPAAMEGRQIVQWDKDSCSDAGFLKIDLLGLGMLSAVERSVEMIARTRGEHVDLSRIPYDDPATYECIQSADTTGVFQIESRAQMQSLFRTRPENLKDITIQVAIVRPGPIQGGAVNPYIERRQRLRVDPDYQIPYEHPSLEPALRETLGAIIFQDQVIEVAIAFAGFSPGEAEGLRRAMSRKRSDAAIEAYHRRFVAGARRRHGVDEETAERVFSMVRGFSGFGFPKAHGAAFGLLAYQSTWLRVHFGREFLCSLLNEQPMGFYPPDALVHEAQRRGIEVLAPDVNESAAECEMEGGSVRIGLGYVRGVDGQEVSELAAVREAGGRFRSLADLASRASSSAASLEMLAWSGACDSLVPGSVCPGRRRDRRAGDRAVAARGGDARKKGARRGAAGAPAGSAGAARAAGADGVGVDARRLRHHRVDRGCASNRAAQGPAARGSGHESRAGDASPRHPRHGGRARGGAPAPRHGQRDRVRAARGRVRDDQPDRSRPIYERHRLIVRTEPLMLAEGKLEALPAAGGAINILVDRVQPIAAPDHLAAEVKDFSMLDEQVRRGLAEQRSSRETDAEDFRAVAPPVMSFASGRRR